jgi:hypothetical protein
LGLFFVLGYRTYPKLNPPPEQKIDTIRIYDTVLHEITNDVHHYKTKIDTVIFRDTVFRDVDTSEILKDYFAFYIYDRVWQDSLLTVVIKDTISQNKPIGNLFTYKILRPQEIITNVTNTYVYSRSLYIDFSIDIKKAENVNFGLSYAFSRYLIGIQYNPSLNTFGLKGGVRIAKFR